MANNVTEIEEKSKSFLYHLVKYYKIFIDTCSLLSIRANKFWEHITPILKAQNASVIVPYRVYEEVEKYADNLELCKKKVPNDPNFNLTAKKAKKKILSLYEQGLVKIFGDKTDNFADNVFQTVFTKFRMKYNLLLITQDKDLASDIMKISESKSVMANNKILVRKINNYGYLSAVEKIKVDVNKNEPKKSVVNTVHNGSQKKKVQVSVAVPEDEIFAHTDTITVVTGSVNVSEYPKENCIVTAKRGGNSKTIHLLSKVSSGGEGIIYTTDIPNVVAKIYKPQKVDRAKFEKLKLMMTKNINCPGVCFPIALLYNTKGEFVGYLMNKAKGIELQKGIFIPRLLQKHFPNWKKKDTVQLCITILKKFKYLHDRNIILGDINPNNILVVSPTEVYFVDTDSYQIEGYPCPVGTINFTAPEIQGKRYDEFLRTLGNEQFAVATLLFMIMLPGKPPYALQGGESQSDNIINGDFAYASGERTNGKAPEGAWRYIWSHMPRYLKDDFYETFHKYGAQHSENSRFSDDDWIKKFEYYEKLLTEENSKFLANDSMSGELIPNRLKKVANVTYVRCKLCGREVDEERTEQGYCSDCLRKGETYNCSRCGNEMVYTNYQRLIRHSHKFDTCKACNDKLNSIYRRYPCRNPRCNNMVEITFRYKEKLEQNNKPLPTVCKDCRNEVYATRRCSICNRVFDITFSEKEYYDSKGYDFPKKCPNCRGVKIPVHRGSSYYNTPRTYNNSIPQPTQKKKSSFCFITTAVCKYFNKPDDCYELTLLRKFRDTWLVKQPGGNELVKEYYSVAPNIVTALDNYSEKDKVYIHIWNNYIKPCIKLIELGANDTCKDLYMNMVNELKEKFN